MLVNYELLNIDTYTATELSVVPRVIWHGRFQKLFKERELNKTPYINALA